MLKKLGGRSSEIIRNLNLRTPKAWDVIDGIFACGKPEDKKEIALFLLNKAIPNQNINENYNYEQEPLNNEEFRKRFVILKQYADADSEN